MCDCEACDCVWGVTEYLCGYVECVVYVIVCGVCEDGACVHVCECVYVRIGCVYMCMVCVVGHKYMCRACVCECGTCVHV